MIELSRRLSLIAQFVNEGSSVCDVGTDHGYLPAFLYLSGRCPLVCATDIREKPLLNAKRNIEKLGADGVKLLLCDGLAEVTREMADTVIIAGMGGEVISGIMERCAFLRDNTVELILQPMTAARELRQYLAGSGFVVECEQAVAENGKIYTVMKVRYSGAPYSADERFLSIGLLRYDSDESRQYIDKQHRICKAKLADLESGGKTGEEYIKASQLLLKLEEIMRD